LAYSVSFYFAGGDKYPAGDPMQRIRIINDHDTCKCQENWTELKSLTIET